MVSNQTKATRLLSFRSIFQDLHHLTRPFEEIREGTNLASSGKRFLKAIGVSAYAGIRVIYIENTRKPSSLNRQPYCGPIGLDSYTGKNTFGTKQNLELPYEMSYEVWPYWHVFGRFIGVTYLLVT